MSVTYREIGKSDYPALKTLINSMERLDERAGDPYLTERALSAYLREILASATIGKVAVHQGEVVGVIFGSAKGQRKRYQPWRNRAGYIIDALRMLVSNQANRRFALSYQRGIAAVYQRLIAGKKHRYDGAIDLFVVLPGHQGLHIGTTLLDDILDYFRRVGGNRIYLYTDTNCNYGYYDHKGFSLVGKMPTSLQYPQQRLDLTVFMYELEL